MAIRGIYCLIITIWLLSICDCVLFGGFGDAVSQMTTTPTTAYGRAQATKTDDKVNEPDQRLVLGETTMSSSASNTSANQLHEQSSSVPQLSSGEKESSFAAKIETIFTKTVQENQNTTNSYISISPTNRAASTAATRVSSSTRKPEKAPTTTNQQKMSTTQTTAASPVETRPSEHASTTTTSGAAGTTTSKQTTASLMSITPVIPTSPVQSTDSKKQSSSSSHSASITDTSTESFHVTTSVNASTNNSDIQEHTNITSTVSAATAASINSTEVMSTRIPTTNTMIHKTNNSSSRLTSATTQKTPFNMSTAEYQKYDTTNATLLYSENTTDIDTNSTVDSERLQLVFTDDDTSDSFWPVVMALTIVIPSVIVFGVTITVLYRRRMTKPWRPLSSDFSQM